jgi:hypothetical protein
MLVYKWMERRRRRRGKYFVNLMAFLSFQFILSSCKSQQHTRVTESPKHVPPIHPAVQHLKDGPYWQKKKDFSYYIRFKW